jgi:co-chaperonin GroES (HSP10)
MIKTTEFVRQSILNEKDWRQDEDVLRSFPQVVPKVLPAGARVLCQLVSQQSTTKSGIVLVEETRETERWNNQVARVIALGELAFCNRETGQPWREGMWCEPGDFVIIPRWGGMRRTVKTAQGEDPVSFVTVNDHEIIERVYGNPLDLDVYIL